jgi:hypothetical protein
VYACVRSPSGEETVESQQSQLQNVECKVAFNTIAIKSVPSWITYVDFKREVNDISAVH